MTTSQIINEVLLSQSKIHRLFDFKEKYDNELKDTELINFFVENDDYDFEEPSKVIEENGVKYANIVGIDFLSSPHTKMYQPHKVVYPCRSIILTFDYPMLDRISFTCRADDEAKGFTNQELLHKILKYFRLIQTIHYYYDFNQGSILPSPQKDQKFLGCCLGDELYTNALIVGIVYNKSKKEWVVSFDDYV